MTSGILAAIDFSSVTEAVLAQARQLAQALGAKVWLIHVATTEMKAVAYDVPPTYLRDDVAFQLKDQHSKLQQYKKSLQMEGLDATAMLVSGGAPAEKILEEASRLNPLLIIVGSHGHGALHHLLTGSITEGVLKRSSWPVVVVSSKAAAGREFAPAAQRV